MRSCRFRRQRYSAGELTSSKSQESESVPWKRTLRIARILVHPLQSWSSAITLKVWSKKKRKTPSSLKISTPFRRSASALFSSHRLQLECPNPTSASRGSEQNLKG